VLAVSALVLVPASLDSATTSLMLAQGKLKRALVPIAIGVVVLLVLNLVLDSRLGAMGAAVARPIAASVIAVINASFSLRGVGSRWFGVRLLGMLGSAVLLAALLWLGRGVPVISVPVAGLVYLGCLALVRVITIDDLRALRGRPAHA
jgi:O-antigen/teichoic acid export membrane protein